jgi:hypothetical protein
VHELSNRISSEKIIPFDSENWKSLELHSSKFFALLNSIDRESLQFLREYMIGQYPEHDCKNNHPNKVNIIAAQQFGLSDPQGIMGISEWIEKVVILNEHLMRILAPLGERKKQSGSLPNTLLTETIEKLAQVYTKYTGIPISINGRMEKFIITCLTPLNTSTHFYSESVRSNLEKIMKEQST